jgi:peptidoglycan/LPS O-acetylase OafA/YrhL
MTNAGTLLVGCVLALMLRDKPAQSTAAAYGGVAVMAIVITLGTVAVLSTSYTHVLVTLATAPIIAHCVYGSSLLTRALSVRWMVHLGSISYAFYLWHFPILLALDWNTGLPGWVNSMIGLILTVAIAEFSMRFIESPALRLKDRIGPLRSDGMAREPKNVPEPGD